MSLFLLLWTLSSFLINTILATFLTLSASNQSPKLFGIIIVCYWILTGLLQWQLLKHYISFAFKWCLVTIIGGIISSALFALLCFLIFAFWVTFALGGLSGFVSLSGEQLFSLTFVSLLSLIICLLTAGFCLGYMQNYLLKLNLLKVNDRLLILTSFLWLIGAIFYWQFFNYVNGNYINGILLISIAASINNFVKDWSIAEVLDINNSLTPRKSLYLESVAIGVSLLTAFGITYPNRYHFLESIGFTKILEQEIIAGKIDAQKYVAAGGKLNFKLSQNSLLSQAIYKENKSLIKFILDQGVNVNQKDETGNTLLHLTRNKEIAEYLLDRNANPNIQNNQGDTPLHSLASEQEIAKLLLVRGANINIKNKSGQTPIFFHGDRDSIELLVAYGADINLKDNQGLTALYYSISKAGSETSNSPAEIEKKAQVSIFLLEHGANVNIKDASGKTPLHLTYNQKVMESLIAHGADVNARDREGNTPIYSQIIYYQGKKLMEVLIVKGAKVNVSNSNGITPMHLAIGDIDTMKILLAKGANVNAKDNLGRTPIDLLIKMHGNQQQAQNQDRIKLLQSYGGVCAKYCR